MLSSVCYVGHFTPSVVGGPWVLVKGSLGAAFSAGGAHFCPALLGRCSWVRTVWCQNGPC